MAFGDARIDALHQAGKLEKPTAGIGMRGVRAGVLSVSSAPLSGGRPPKPRPLVRCRPRRLQYMAEIVHCTYSMCY